MTGITSLLMMARGKAKARLGSRSASRSRKSTSTHRRRADSRSDGIRTHLPDIDLHEIEKVRAFTHKVQKKERTWRDEQVAQALQSDVELELERERLRQLRREEKVVFSIPDPRFDQEISPLDWRHLANDQLPYVDSDAHSEHSHAISNTTRSHSDTDTASSADESTMSVTVASEMDAISKAVASVLDASGSACHTRTMQVDGEWYIVASIEERQDYWKEMLLNRAKRAMFSTAEGMERVQIEGTTAKVLSGGGIGFDAVLVDPEEAKSKRTSGKYYIKVVLEIDWGHGKPSGW